MTKDCGAGLRNTSGAGAGSSSTRYHAALARQSSGLAATMAAVAVQRVGRLEEVGGTAAGLEVPLVRMTTEEIHHLLDTHVRAMTAKAAAEVRIEKLQARQQQLEAARGQLESERVQLVAGLAVARSGLSPARHNSRYSSFEGDGSGSGEMRASPQPYPYGHGGLSPSVQQQQAALRNVDERLDAVGADLAYCDGMLQDMRRVVQRADGCGLELRRRLARMDVADVRSALHMALEALTAAKQPKGMALSTLQV